MWAGIGCPGGYWSAKWPCPALNWTKLCLLLSCVQYAFGFGPAFAACPISLDVDEDVAVSVDVDVDVSVCWHELQSAARVGVTIWQDQNSNSNNNTRASWTMANAFMCRNEKLLSACAIWTQFGNAFRHIKLKWPETGPTGAKLHIAHSKYMAVPKSKGPFHLLSVGSCVYGPACSLQKLLTLAGKSEKAKQGPKTTWVWEMKLFGDYAALKPNVPFNGIHFTLSSPSTHFTFIYMSLN